MSHERYSALVSLVRGVIHRWDPYSLLAHGALDDEFDHEIALVTARVRFIKTETDAITTLSTVFSEMFESGHFTPEMCSVQGRELFMELRTADFLQ